jgi:putative ABC transport system permease protein
MLTLRLAWRNLWRHRRRTWLTASAMVFSNVLLVFSISLQIGSYDMMIENTLRAFSGYLQVQKAGYNEDPKFRNTITGIESVARTVRERLPDAQVAARASGFALASSAERTFGIQLTGVEPAHEAAVSRLPGQIRDGRFLSDPRAAEIYIGAVLARNLKVAVGDEITLLGSGRDGSFAAGVVTVAGVFESGMPEMDRSFAELPLTYFQDLFAMPGQGHSVAVALPTLDRVPAAAASLSAAFADQADLRVLDWEALNPGLKQAIQTDMSSGFFMYGVLIVLVAFSVLNTQLMSVMERTREFGMISALGVRPRHLSGLILLETALMALIGFALGVFLGWLVALYFNRYGLTYPGMEEAATRFNLPDRMYPAITPLTLTLGPLVVFAFCLLASLYPALRLLRLRPVDAMRAA